MNSFLETASTIGLALIGLALASVILSKNSTAVPLTQTIASGFGNVMGVAESPVTGNSYAIDLAYPTTASGSFGA